MIVKHRVFGGVLLITGTTIGAAMLALPPVTGIAGFFPSLLLFFCYWILLSFSAMCMLEVTLWMEDNTNLLTMARRTLGITGELISWTTYLFLLYALTTAYLSGGSSIILDFIDGIFGVDLPQWFGPIPMLVIFGFFVFRGMKYVDIANRTMMLGLVVTFAAIIALLTPHLNIEYLARSDWKYLLVSNSVIATAFGYHIIIPSLATYLHRNPRHLCITIIIGGFIPLLVYALWELLTLGIIPVEGTYGIVSGYTNDINGAKLLSHAIGGSIITLVIRFFAFFAIITSFLGVSLSLRDFLADGFHIKKTIIGRAKLYLLTFIPALLIIWINPNTFILALEYAGAFGVMVLLAILPAVMVWRGRYHLNMPKTHFRAPGGKVALILLIAVSAFIVFLEISNKFGFTQLYFQP